jgi:hypothetical protein
MTRKYRFGHSLGALFRVLQKIKEKLGAPEKPKEYRRKNFTFPVNSLAIMFDMDLPEVEQPQIILETLTVKLPKKVFE